ncbi:hypothetical protein BKA66DRAFT_553130 [Pyrenochaeta sp. MPI-SDFR-AT-0127]|nr:hypothetical protein BKA66DRAFT_553130 [Pyrenochaeta sp. MPI-SDFR-AT-0127]
MNSHPNYQALVKVMAGPPLYNKANLAIASTKRVCFFALHRFSRHGLYGQGAWTSDFLGTDYMGKAHGPRMRIDLAGYHQFAMPDLFSDPLWQPSFKLSLIKAAYYDGPPPRKQCCDIATYKQNFQKIMEAWRESEFCQYLRSYIEKGSAGTVPVTAIFCFDLGGLGMVNEPGYHESRGLLRHVAAMEIRDTLQRIYQGTEIPIFAQDHKYCTCCVETLRSYDIEVLSSPAAFLRVDGNSFIISRSPETPVRQITADLTDTWNGPAGMLCDKIIDNGLCDLPLEKLRDASSPRLFQYKILNARHTRTLDDSEATLVVEGAVYPAAVFGEVGLYRRGS